MGSLKRGLVARPLTRVVWMIPEVLPSGMTGAGAGSFTSSLATRPCALVRRDASAYAAVAAAQTTSDHPIQRLRTVSQ